MKKPNLSSLRLDVVCPNCRKKNFKPIGELISNEDFTCVFCSTGIKLADDKSALATFNEVIDFWKTAYFPK